MSETFNCVQKNMSSGSFKNIINKMCLEIIYLIYTRIITYVSRLFRMSTFIDSTHMKL